MEHITGGACGELVILSTYFRFQPQMTSLPANAKIVSVGRHGNYHGQPPRVVNPCLGTADFPGCLDFLGYLGLNWCGTNDVQIKKRREIGALRRRDNTDSTAELDFSDFQFICHKAKSSPEYSNHEPFPATPNGDVVYQETVPATDATHVPNDPVPTLDMTESTGVSDDPIPTLATTGQAVSDNGDVIPTLATSTRPNVTGPMSNQGSGGQIEGTTGSPSATPSPQSAPDGSGINANPQDPYADTGPGRVKPP